MVRVIGHSYLEKYVEIQPVVMSSAGLLVEVPTPRIHPSTEVICFS